MFVTIALLAIVITIMITSCGAVSEPAAAHYSSMEEAYYAKYADLAEKYGTHILYDGKRDYCC